MAVDQINKIYDEMYNNKYNSLLNSKQQSLNNIDTQEKEAETNAYDYRNQAASQNAMNTQQTRDYMAKNNLLQSGESVDALLRNQASYTNNLGTINSNLQKYKNQYATDRNTINSNFENDANTYKGQVESERAKALYDYQEKLRQEELQRQLAAYSSSGGSGYSSSSGYSNFEDEATANMKALKSDFNSYLSDGDVRNARDKLFAANRALQLGLISGEDYMSMQNSLTEYENKQSAKETQTKKDNGQKLTYGYRNGVAGYY